MIVWIIYKEGFGFSRIVAEMIQDRLEDYIDVYLGNAKKIDPAFLVEERLDYLIIGDILSELIPSLEIQNWLLKYWEIVKNNNLIVSVISGFYVALTDNTVEPSWIKFLHDNVKNEIIYPPILRLNLNMAELSIENETLELIKQFSNDIIEFIINDKDKAMKGNKIK